VAVVDDEVGRLDFSLRRGAEQLGVDLEMKQFAGLKEAVWDLQKLDPDVVLMDLGGTCPEVTADRSKPIAGALGVLAVRLLCPGAQIGVVTRLHEARVVGRLRQLGALAYLQIDDVWNGGPHELVASLCQVAQGRAILSEKAAHADLRWLNCARPETGAGHPLMVGLRPGHEIGGAEEDRLREELRARARDDVAATFTRALGRCQPLWRPHLHESLGFEVFTAALVEGDLYLAVGEAKLPLREPATPREKEIARRKLAGRSHPQIAEELGIELSTVEKHIENFMNRLEPDVPRKGLLAAQIILGQGGEPRVSNVRIERLRLPVERPLPMAPRGAAPLRLSDARRSRTAEAQLRLF
jgi:DNA-binding NarL/FixJ family response regulator